MQIIKNNVKQVTINVINQGVKASMITNAIINNHPLCWCNGFLFSFEPYMMTDWTAQKAAAGEFFYFSVTHCKLEKYSDTLDDGNNQKVAVLNLNHHAFWREVLANV